MKCFYCVCVQGEVEKKNKRVFVEEKCVANLTNENSKYFIFCFRAVEESAYKLWKMKTAVEIRPHSREFQIRHLKCDNRRRPQLQTFLPFFFENKEFQPLLKNVYSSEILKKGTISIGK